jgi:NTP pyrophosphatase (non-canonical NTP hydrolase)
MADRADDRFSAELLRAAKVLGVRPEVLWLAQAMEKKLQKNDHKGKWGSFGTDKLQWWLDRLQEEVEELRNAAHHEGAEATRLEAADVANFALMIADTVWRSEYADLPVD